MKKKAATSGGAAKHAKRKRAQAKVVTDTGADLRPLKPKVERKLPWPDGFASWPVEQQIEFRAKRRASLDFQAKQRLAAILDIAVNDPKILQSSEHARFAALMRELLAESFPSDRLEEMLRPLETLISSWRSGTGDRKAGRPSAATTWDQWSRLVEARRRAHPSVKLSEIRDDVAAQWNDEHASSRPITGKTIADALSKRKKLLKG